MKLPKPDAVIFDWDNTLVDNWSVIRDALNDTLVSYGHEPWTLEETHARVAKSLKDGFPVLFGDKWQDAQKLFYERFEASHLNDLKPIDGAFDLLDELSGGSYLAVVSNKRGDLLRAEAAHLEWADFFSRLVGASDAASDKPASDPLDLALDGSGLSRSPAVWYLGDGPIDIEFARNAGIGAVLVNPGRFTPEEVANLEPDHEVPSLAAFAALVRDA